jgi:hypothetical protein
MSNDNIWISLITYGGGIATALGLGKIIPAFIEWWKENRSATTKRLEDLTKRLEIVEEELEREKSINQNTQSTLRAMLPLMRSIMKDHPIHLELLDQLEKNIFGYLQSADGESNSE